MEIFSLNEIILLFITPVKNTPTKRIGCGMNWRLLFSAIQTVA